MKNMGMFDPLWNPVKPGGLTSEEIAALVAKGWKEGTTEKEVKDVAIGFRSPDLPGGFTMHNFTVPKGLKFLYNPDDERAIIPLCGNPSCWRYLRP